MGAFFAGENIKGHGVGDAGDEVADVGGSGEFWHRPAVGDPAHVFGKVIGFAFLEGFLCGMREHPVAYVDGEVGNGIDAGVPRKALMGTGGRFGFGNPSLLELPEKIVYGSLLVYWIFRHGCALRAGLDFVDWPLDLIVRLLGIIIGKGQWSEDSAQGSGGIGDVVCVIFNVSCEIAENYCVIFYANCDGEFIYELDGG